MVNTGACGAKERETAARCWPVVERSLTDRAESRAPDSRAPAFPRPPSARLARPRRTCSLMQPDAAWTRVKSALLPLRANCRSILSCSQTTSIFAIYLPKQSLCRNLITPPFLNVYFACLSPLYLRHAQPSFSSTLVITLLCERCQPLERETTRNDRPYGNQLFKHIFINNYLIGWPADWHRLPRQVICVYDALNEYIQLFNYRHSQFAWLLSGIFHSLYRPVYINTRM